MDNSINFRNLFFFFIFIIILPNISLIITFDLPLHFNSKNICNILKEYFYDILENFCYFSLDFSKYFVAMCKRIKQRKTSDS